MVEINLGGVVMQEKEYPPKKGSYLMYPCYNRDNELIGFSSDYEAEGAYGNLCMIECIGIYKR